MLIQIPRENKMSITLPAIHIAFWGGVSSGKTSLMARYYGLLKNQLDNDPNFDLVPFGDDALHLISYYDIITKLNVFPATTTAFSNRTYNFAYCHENTTEKVLPIEWVDYPGKWWQGKDISDESKRHTCLISICSSEVIFLLIDGFEFIKSPESYLPEVIKRYHEELLDLKRTSEFQSREKKLDEFVITLTKTDLVRKKDPQFSAKTFKNTLEQYAGAELQKLWNEINPLGKRKYLTLSIGSSDESGKKIVAHNYIGLDAVAPLAFMAAAGRAQKAHDRVLAQTPDGSIMERLGEGGIALGAIGAVLISVATGGIAAALLVGASIICGGGGGIFKIVGSMRRSGHTDVADKLEKVVRLVHHLEEERRSLLYRYYYWED